MLSDLMAIWGTESRKDHQRADLRRASGVEDDSLMLT